jgi:hypothetical protein
MWRDGMYLLPLRYHMAEGGYILSRTRTDAVLKSNPGNTLDLHRSKNLKRRMNVLSNIVHRRS